MKEVNLLTRYFEFHSSRADKLLLTWRVQCKQFDQMRAQKQMESIEKLHVNLLKGLQQAGLLICALSRVIKTNDACDESQERLVKWRGNLNVVCDAIIQQVQEGKLPN